MGADPRRIEAARAAIQRAQEFDALATELTQIDGVALNASRQLRALVETLQGARVRS